jgi:GPH family glycoside/pentoside/hexuronide:cation symporter
MTMTIWAVLCLVLFLITFFTTRERIQPVNAETKSSPKQDFADLLKNVPWRVMAVMTLVHFAILSFRGGALYNYYHHYADKRGDVRLRRETRPHRASLAGWHQTRRHVRMARLHRPRHARPTRQLQRRRRLQQHRQHDRHRHDHRRHHALGRSPKRFGKKAVAVAGFALSTLNAFAFYFLSPTDVTGMVALTISGSIVYAPTIPLVWAIFADVADYSE